MERDGGAVALGFVRALADEDRLKIAGLLAIGERSAADLAAALGLADRAVAHHLARLDEAGLLAAGEGGGARRYRLDGAALRALGRAALAGTRPALAVGEGVGEEWERRVLGNFLAGDQLKEIPAARQKRLVVLHWLVARFEPGVAYPEKQVNEIIKAHHPDFATLRRLLVDEGLMARERGVYRRSEK